MAASSYIGKDYICIDDGEETWDAYHYMKTEMLVELFRLLII